MSAPESTKIQVKTIAALFVQKGGCYYGLPQVDPWDVERDARLYDGPHPVVAHPPCERWCQMAPVNQARYGHRVGDDGGCFAAALAAVRRWGGVLEHPALSLAWPAFNLPRPLGRGWQKTFCGGWVAHVEQRLYGHRARKATWLYCFGVEPPSMAWGRGPAPEAWISADRPRAVLKAIGIAQLGKREAKATPTEFRDLLLSIARSVELPAPLALEGPASSPVGVSSQTCGRSVAGAPVLIDEDDDAARVQRRLEGSEPRQVSRSQGGGERTGGGSADPEAVREVRRGKVGSPPRGLFTPDRGDLAVQRVPQGEAPRDATDWRSPPSNGSGRAGRAETAESLADDPSGDQIKQRVVFATGGAIGNQRAGDPLSPGANDLKLAGLRNGSGPFPGGA